MKNVSFNNFIIWNSTNFRFGSQGGIPCKKEREVRISSELCCFCFCWKKEGKKIYTHLDSKNVKSQQKRGEKNTCHGTYTRTALVHLLNIEIAGQTASSMRQLLWTSIKLWYTWARFGWSPSEYSCANTRTCEYCDAWCKHSIELARGTREWMTEKKTTTTPKQMWSMASERVCVCVVHNSNMVKDEEIIILHLCGT